MPNTLQTLLKLFELEQLETNLFRGLNELAGPPRVFGGQVIGQALIAARRTVDERHCHSLHGYFLRPGDPKIPIVYEVDRIRDGRSFTTRRVIAIQRGEAIFNMSASFHVMEQGLSHQFKMPDVEGPEGLPSAHESYVDNLEALPERLRNRFATEQPIEMRRTKPINILKPEKQPPYQNTWFRVREPMPDDMAMHQCLLAYASDMGLLSTSALPHGKSFMSGLMTASLDHAMWFHRPFRMDEWILFAQDSPSAEGARGFNRGVMYAQDGTLIASVVQEGLIREID